MSSPARADAPTILLVDDDTETLTVLRVVLEGQGYTVAVAPSAREAFDRLAKSDPAVVLSDVRMPSMDGITFCRTLRDKGLTKAPIVLMSGQASERERAEGYAAGCADFLSKPVRREELLARVRAYVDRWTMSHALSNVERELAKLRQAANETLSHQPIQEATKEAQRHQRLRDFFTNRAPRLEGSAVYVEFRSIGETRDGDGHPLLERISSAFATLEQKAIEKPHRALVSCDGFGALLLCLENNGEKHEGSAVGLAIELRDELRSCFRSGIGARAELECAVGVSSGTLTAGEARSEGKMPSSFVSFGGAAAHARSLAQLAAPNDVLVAELCWVRSHQGREPYGSERVGPLRHPRLAELQYAYRPLRKERQAA